MKEKDTCREYVNPKIKEAGWLEEDIYEEKTFTDGRIIVIEDKVCRGKQKRADYLLYYKRNLPIAVIEAKADYKNASDGLQQAKEYAEILGLNFAYSTNGKKIIEYDFFTGKERILDSFPSKENLWKRYLVGEKILEFSESDIEILLNPFSRSLKKNPRYYQEIAVNQIIKAILTDKNRILITMATGTGKTYVAFQVIWKLWNRRWNRKNKFGRPKILYLADRDVLIADPFVKDFSIFDKAKHRIRGVSIKSREIYFSTYQAIAKDVKKPGLYREYNSDFFDLIVVDECHRGSARDDSNWREILEYFYPAVQLGMTATPKRDDNIDTYHYFGNPVYQYSLKQGIEDGFLAPYKVKRIITSIDAMGYRPAKHETDKTGKLIPDKEYKTKDFEKTLVIEQRTKAVAGHLTNYLKNTDRFAKTIVFCVDQEHSDNMRRALNNLNDDLSRKYPNYVARIVSDEGFVGKRLLSDFMDIDKKIPVIVTTSKLLTTGVDIPTCKNIVIFKTINSMTEFKQIIGRGSRIRDDYGKYYFNIIDYTGDATRKFADPDFDGWPVNIIEETIDEIGNTLNKEKISELDIKEQGITEEDPILSEKYIEEIIEKSKHLTKKYYLENNINVEIIADLVYEFDLDGNRLEVKKYTEYTGEQVRSMFTSASELRSKWSKEKERHTIISALKEKGITLKDLIVKGKIPDADPFDLLCHFAFNVPIRTRRERADRIRKEEMDFIDKLSKTAKEILSEILEKYAEFGIEQIDSNILKIPPISDYGNLMEISKIFGGSINLRKILEQLQNLLYAT